MKRRIARIFRWPSISATAGILSLAAVIALGAWALANLPAGAAVASDEPLQPSSLAPYFGGASAHLNATTGASFDNRGAVEGGPGPVASGHGQQTMKPGVTVSQVSLVVREGQTATYTVRLDSAPSADVIVTISAMTDAEFQVDPLTLTFTPGNWSDPQDVTVTTHVDADDEADYRTLSHQADGDYAAVEIDQVTVVVVEACDVIWCGILEFDKVNPYQLRLVDLDEAVFQHDGVDHRITNSMLTTRVLPGDEAQPPFAIPERASLRFWLRGGLAGTGYYTNWTLSVNEVALPFSEARVVYDDLEGNERLLFRWYAPGLNQWFPSGQGAQGASLYLRIEDTGDPEPQPPGPPIYLRIPVTHSAPNTLVLLWNRPHTLDDYYHELTAFNVQWKQSDGNWDTPADVAEASVEPLDNATHGYVIRDLEGGQSYDMRVIAVNEVGESEPSEVLTAVAPSDGS